MISLKNTTGLLLVPLYETNTCSYLRRNHDIILGSTEELYFCMQFVGHYICRKEFHIPKRRIEKSILLLLTLSGEGKLFYRNNVYALTKGTCMLIDARNIHEYHAVGDGWEFKYLHLWGAMSEKYISYIEEHSPPVFMLFEDEFSQVNQTLDRILSMTEEALISDYPGISRMIYSLLMLWFSHDTSQSNSRSPGSSSLSEAVVYIHQNYMHNISTGDIARAANLSRSYMSELFTHTYGIPPHEYLLLYRLSVAKEILLNTKLSVTEIAERTGFRDVFTFSRIFKRKMEISPLKYRQNHGMQ